MPFGVAGFQAALSGLDPNLQQVEHLGFGRIKLAVRDAAPCTHHLDLTRSEHSSVPHAVLVLDGAVDHITEDLHVAVRVSGESAARRNVVLIDHSQRTKAPMGRIIVIRKAKGVRRLEPTVVGVTAFLRPTDLHFRYGRFHAPTLPVKRPGRQCDLIGLSLLRVYARRGMELRQLRYFVAVAENGNISRAAKQIFLTQPALSRQIKALEEELGQCLFERQAHSIRLTAAGELLLHEARALLQQAEELLGRIRTAGQAVRLRVGYAPSLAAGLLSAAVEHFTQTHPEARVELFDLSTAEMLTGLETGKLDVVLTVGHDRSRQDLRWTPLLRAPWKVVVNRRHPLAGRSSVTPAEIARQPLLAFSRRDYPEYWEIIRAWFRQYRVQPKVRGEYDGVDSLLAAAESGLGVAIVALRHRRLIPEGVCLKTVAEAPNALCIAAGIQKDRSEDSRLRLFVEALRTAARSAR